jgi:hypothetical protein
MKITRILGPLMAAGAAAAIIAAPTAAAADQPNLTCTYTGAGNSQCESPGNAQLNASPPYVPYVQQYPFIDGGGILFHHGGGHR